MAAFMVSWVAGSGKRGIHDPAFGLGAFYDALPSPARFRFTATEVDPIVARFWQRNAPDAVDLAVTDYLLSWGRQADNVVCNPPYMRFQHFKNRDVVQKEFYRRTGVRLSGYTNVASVFLLKSLEELAPSGRLAYVMPLEFLNTGYGSVVKQRLIDGGHLAGIIRLECEKEVFPEVTTSVGIVLYDAASVHRTVRFFNVSTLHELNGVLSNAPHTSIPFKSLDPKAKWLHLFKRSGNKAPRTDMVPIGRYGRFHRGIATGANEFFALTPTRIGELGMSASDYKPCITRSAHVQRAVFDENDFVALTQRDKATFLFSPGNRPSVAAQRYIDFGQRRGFDQRYLTASRKPWFRTENRVPAPILVGVFSRGGYKVVRNRAPVVSLTCFHGFQPNALGLHHIDRLFLYLMSDVGRQIVALSSRQYGDALEKFEPNDLNTALAPNPTWFALLDRGDVASAMAHVRDESMLPQELGARFEALMVSKGNERDFGVPTASRRLPL
ncbi:MAG: N-6 DNA methylase [Gammaproteobacteria bacterium]|nr:N-6 DNA methylase [Gammaproteobacteria bacterium]